MTVTEKSSRKLITGSGWANPLTHNFELENSTHLKVYADDVELTLGVDYSISGIGVESGYSVTISTPGSWAPVVWVLSVEPPISQADDVSLGGAYGARFEDSLDALTRRVQRLRDDTRRAYKVPRTTVVGEAPTMDVLAEGHFWVAGADGNMIDGGDGDDILYAEEYAERAEAAAAAALAGFNGFLFPTLAAAQAFHPPTSLSCPTVVETLFRDSTQINGSGAVYKRIVPDQTTGDLVLTPLVGAAIGYTLAGRTISATAFGLSPAASGAANMAALKAAVAACQAGGVLLIPDMGATATIDTSAGLTGACYIDKAGLTVRVEGHLKASYAAYEANPAFMLRVTADRVKFRGHGTIEGPGNFIATNGTTLNIPGLVYVDGDKFSTRGLRYRRPPMTGLMLIGDYADVIGNLFEGGPITWNASTRPPPTYTIDNDPASGGYVPGPDPYAGSGHFAIVSTGSKGHKINYNNFLPDEDGGSVVNAIFSAGVSGVTVTTQVIGNYCLNAWEKLFYGYGDRHVVANNIVLAASPYGYTDAIRAWGAYHVVTGNIINGYRGGMQVLDAVGCVVTNNILTNLRNSGINVQHFTNIADGFSGTCAYNKVNGNHVSRDPASAEARRFGIRVLGHADNHMVGIEVCENIVVGWGLLETDYSIELTAGTGKQIQNSKCSDNLIVNAGSGIKATRFTNGVVARNRFSSLTDIGIEILGGNSIEVSDNIGSDMGTYTLSIGTGGDVPTDVRFTNNRMLGATNIAIRNFSFASVSENWAEGNQWTAKALTGSVTLNTGGATTTVTHGGVAPHATIDLVPTTALFASRLSGDGLYTGPNVNDISIVNAAGSSATAASIGRYIIHQ